MAGPPPIDRAEIERRFRNHPPTGTLGGRPTGETLDEITEIMVDAATALAALPIPECREKSAAFTELEKVSFFAKAAAARNQEEA